MDDVIAEIRNQHEGAIADQLHDFQFASGSLLSDAQKSGGRIANRDKEHLANYSIDLIICCYGKTRPPLVPRVPRLLAGFGSHLKLARLRRKYSAETVTQRAGITRRILSKVEQGNPAVALGVYARVMQVLRLEDDLALLAVDDELVRKLQDAGGGSNSNF